MFSTGGGVGISVEKLAPKGAKINNTAETTSGAVSFMPTYDAVGGVIGSNGRRSALIITITDDHPDLVDFINSKTDLGNVTNANISIKITDDFMKAAKSNEGWWLSFERHTGEKIEKKVSARDILMLIAKNAHDQGEPGLLWFDEIRRHNMLAENDWFNYENCNPCFAGNMSILTVEGYKTFAELEGKEIEIINKDGLISESRVWSSGIKRILDMRLSTKEIISCTGDHVFMTNDKKECEAKDMLKKKVMPYLNQNNYYDDDFVKYGFIQGDGNLGRLDSKTHKGLEINIGQSDSDVADFFGYVVKGRKVYVNGFNEVLIALGFSSKSLPERTLPSTFEQWTEGQQISFIRGCYSANGSVLSNGRITYKTTCSEFANQLNWFLNDKGYSSYITTNRKQKVKFENGEYECRESYDVNIQKYNSRIKFYNNIGFIQNYKNERLKTLLINEAPTVIGLKYKDAPEKVYDFTEPISHWGIVEGYIVHNCGELPLPGGTSPNGHELWGGACNLGAMNLTQYICFQGAPGAFFDLHKLREDTKIAFKAMNEVLFESTPLLPFEELQQSVKDWRINGMGHMGLASVFVKLGIKYGSERSINLAREIQHTILNACVCASVEEVGKYGTHKYYDYKYLSNNDFFTNNIKPDIRRAVAEFGLVNAAFCTVAPSGTLSTMLGISGGIEPFYQINYTRTTKTLHSKDVDYEIFINEAQEWLRLNKGIENPTREDVSLLPNYFVASHDINWIDRIAVQAAVQQYNDGAISSTINLPEQTTVNEIYDLYLSAWKNKLKGLTLFRNNCRRTGILSTKKDDEKPQQNITMTGNKIQLNRGDIICVDDNLTGLKKKLMTGCGSLHCSVFADPISGELMETYLCKGSTGVCNSSLTAMSRLMSLAARGGISIEDIVDQLQSVPACPSYVARKATKNDVSPGTSCASAVAYATTNMQKEIYESIICDDDDAETETTTVPLNKYGGIEPSVPPMIATLRNSCPVCNEELVYEGGCVSCVRGCGWSKCH